jgi:hypothetical protein
VYPSVTQYCRQRLSGIDKMITSPTPSQYYSDAGTAIGPAYCKIEVFPCDPALLNPIQPAPPAPQVPPVVAPKPGFTYWNEAEFGQRIAVRVSGDYKPALPNFLLMGTTFPVTVVVTMGSEG